MVIMQQPATVTVTSRGRGHVAALLLSKPNKAAEMRLNAGPVTVIDLGMLYYNYYYSYYYYYYNYYYYYLPKTNLFGGRNVI